MVVLSSGGFGLRLVGLAITLFFVIGALIIVGPSLYFDILKPALVVGGGAGFAPLRCESSNYFENFGHAAVYFGWNGTLIGLIAIAGVTKVMRVTLAGKSPSMIIRIKKFGGSKRKDDFWTQQPGHENSTCIC